VDPVERALLCYCTCLLIFDVEVAVLFPWALVYRQFGLFGFLEMLVFLVILFVGYAYVWVHGDLEWDKPKPEIPIFKRTIITTVIKKSESVL
jgi:NADH:ubiquinone oxidoreductase subunit 3 (subunit A)